MLYLQHLLFVANVGLNTVSCIGQYTFMQPWTKALPKCLFSGSVHTR